MAAEGITPAVALDLRPLLQRRLHGAAGVLRSPPGVALLLGVPLSLYALIIKHAVTGNRKGSDFLSFWSAGRDLLHLHTPYPVVDALPAVVDRYTFAPFVYPAPAAVAMAPFGLLPFPVAATLFLTFNVAAVIAALRLLDVRDSRCYIVAFATIPVLSGASLGAVSPLLLLGVAAAWRFRDRTWQVGAIVGALVVAKLFLWPLWLWLVFTRRYRAAVVSAALGAGTTLCAWALIGFAGLRDYPRLLSRLTELVGTHSYSAFALLHTMGLSVATAQRVVLVVGLALLACAAYRFRATRPDQGTFLVTLGSALALTPILWPHYLVLLFVPIAFARKSLSGLWLAMLYFWLDGNNWSDGYPQLIIPALILGTVPFVYALRTEP